MNRRWLVGSIVVLWVSGCSAPQHRRAADREVYGILRAAERHTLGQTNEFSINTRYSSRPPSSIRMEEILAERQESHQRLLTLPEALQLAVANSRSYQTEKERLYLTALTLSGERYQFSPHWSSGSEAEYERLTDGERRGTISSWVRVSQALVTGGQLSVALANDLLRYYTGDPRRSAVSTVTASLFQPLLRGWGRHNLAVESQTQAERNVAYAVRDFSYFQDEFALDVVADYFDLLAQQDNVRNRYADYQSRSKATRRLEARSHDRERLLDVDKARQSELTAQNNYIATVTAFQNNLDQFKITLGLPVGERLQLDPTPLAELRAVGPVAVGLDPARAFRMATARQGKVLNAIARFEDSQRKVQVMANRLGTDLNLFADVSLASDGPTDYTKFDVHKLHAGAGVELDLPLDRTRQRNDYRAALISFESQIRSLSLTFDHLQAAIQRGVRNLRLRRQTYEIQCQALELANRRVDGAQMLLEAGRAEVRDLLEAQDARVAAQDAVTSALVQYQQQRLQLLLELGLLETSASKFWLQDQVPAELRETASPETLDAPVPSPEKVLVN